MSTIGGEPVNLTLGASEDDDVVSALVDGKGFPSSQFFRLADDVPAVGEGGDGFADFFEFDVIKSVHDDIMVFENVEIDGIEDKEYEASDEVVAVLSEEGMLKD